MLSITMMLTVLTLMLYCNPSYFLRYRKHYVTNNFNVLTGNLQQFRPIEFKANHPFLYFVMDTDIHVNLMAGKIVNPLNSRIR